ncbi:MAG: universal stress protein [Chitinophagaceae bacterium]
MRKDIIIPVDFSETSLNAARYAADMLTGRTDVHVILYNMFDDKKEADNVSQYLTNLKSELEQKGVTNIECVTEQGDNLIDSLGRLAYQKTAELIVMGISEKDEWKQLFFGSNTLKMAEQNICPVMIIPAGANFGGIKNIALASDFEDVDDTTPVLAIKTILEMFKAELHIVNVNNEHYVALSETFLTERNKMQKLFEEFNPEFYFIGMNDFYEAIAQFSKDKNIDLIIIIPKSHSSFINNLLHESHTKKLAFQSLVPLLAAHQ